MYFKMFQFECCGVYNASDWKTRLPLQNDTLPMSCCWKIYGAIGSAQCSLKSPNVYNQGCLSAFGDYVQSHALTIGGVGIGFAVVQVNVIRADPKSLKKFRLASRT